MEHEPNTLQEAIVYFSNPDNCLAYIGKRRWPNGVVCPTCGSKDVGFIKSRRMFQCKTRHPKAQFSIKLGTIFEDSPIGLDKWLLAMWMLANCKNGVSSYEIHRAIKVTQKSAWFMLHRLRLALQGNSGGKLSGEVEVDETNIGGKARNMHKGKRAARIKAPGVLGKTIVMGLLARHGEVRTHVVTNSSQETLQGIVKEEIAGGSELFTDSHPAYFGLDSEYAHKVIDHAEAYVKGNVHTNGMENFWSLLKRGLKGTYVSVEPFHLFRYVDEQVFRYNNRKELNDSGRFSLAVSQIVDKRVTYKQLTGKVGETSFA